MKRLFLCVFLMVIFPQMAGALMYEFNFEDYHYYHHQLSGDVEGWLNVDTPVPGENDISNVTDFYFRFGDVEFTMDDIVPILGGSAPKPPLSLSLSDDMTEVTRFWSGRISSYSEFWEFNNGSPTGPNSMIVVAHDDTPDMFHPDWIGNVRLARGDTYNTQTVHYGLIEGNWIAAEPVPEPATLILLGAGLVGLAGFRKRLWKPLY